MDFLTQLFIATSKKLGKELERFANLLHQQTEAIQKAANAQIESNQSPPIIRPELHVSDTIIDRIKAPDAQENRRENLKVRFEAGTLALVLAYTIFAGYQWFELNTANRNQSAATNGANATAGMSLVYARKQIRTEQRAWVIFDTDYMDSEFTDRIGEMISLPIRLVNVGKTPARNIEGVIVVEELNPSDEPNFEYSHGHPRSIVKTGIIYPTFPTTSAVNTNQVRHRNKVLKVHGRITYDDVFHVQHWLTFCHAISPSPLARTPSCVGWNTVDENDE